MRTRRVAPLLIVLALLGAACSGGGGDESDTVVLGNAGDIDAGQLVFDDEEPEVDDAPEPAAEAADAADADTESAAGADADDGSAEGDTGDADNADDATADDADTGDDEEDEDAIPLNEDEGGIAEQAGQLFDAIDIFNSCLDEEGFEFLGVPSADVPQDDPIMNPNYISALQKCAAESNIQEALQNTQLGSEGLTAEEIEARNEGYLYFEECLTVRGWTLAPAVPDENGMLALQQDGLTPPPGETLMGTDDLRECLGEATSRVEAEAAADQ